MKSGLGKKFFRIGIPVFSIAFLVCCYFFWNTWKTNPEAEIIDVKISPEEIHIGKVIRIEIVSELPSYRQPKNKIQLEIPEGLQVLNDREQTIVGLSGGKWRWKSVLELQAYELGSFQNIKANVSLSPDKNSENIFLDFSLPEIIIAPRLDESITHLNMASELSEDFLRQNKSHTSKWLLLSLTIAALIVITAFFLIRGRPKRSLEPPKPWSVAESLILELEDRLPLDAEIVFVELTDIIRRYIESVYNLRAIERTTPEFLDEMKRNGTQLSSEQGLLLTDFLTAADLVKFARLDATQDQIKDAIKKATRFVVETSEPIIKSQLTEKPTEKLNE